MLCKIKTQKDIIEISKELKQQGKKVVTFNGSFDLLHAGHILALQEAKTQGDVLIVALNSDKSVQSYKGPHRPIVLQKERALQLAALECVDYIVLFDEINSIKILDKIKPDIHCNGADWGKNCVEREIVEKNNGKIHISKWTKGLSTTNLIKKILEVYQKPTKKAIFSNLKISKILGYKNLPIKNIEKNRDKYQLSLNDSWLISNNLDDILTGRMLNIKTIMIADKAPRSKIGPQFIVKNLEQAYKKL